MVEQEQHRVKLDKVIVLSEEEKLRYHRRSGMALENIIVLDEKSKMLIRKNESNRNTGYAKAQMTLLFSDCRTYVVEVHNWGLPPKYRETGKMSNQEICNYIFQGTFYITNISMLL